MSGIQPPDCSKLAKNPKNDNDVTIFRHDINVKFFWRSFVSISSLVLELWQFSFIRDWPEIWKSEIPPSELCPISGDWGKLGIPNIAQISLMNCYWVLQNARVTAFTVSELLRENQQRRGRGDGKIISPNQSRVRDVSFLNFCHKVLNFWWRN